MAKPGTRLKLVPEDDFMHPVEDASNFNESMYFNVFDPEREIGGFFRLGNRPNEGYAEMTCCLYLPDGRVAFTFKRPEIENNDAFDAGGMRFEVVEPHARLRVDYRGKLCLLDDPTQMANPRAAFATNPRIEAELTLEYTGVSPVTGGEPVNADGSPIALDAEKSFARGHTEQHVEATGSLRLGDETFEIAGFGLRDHSWGPRYWQAIHWYRWCPMNFGRDHAMVLSVTCAAGAEPRMGGVVLEDGAYRRIQAVDFETEWDDRHYQKSFVAHVAMEDGETFDVRGEVMSLIPLRNRRQSPDGEMLMTRITEGMTRYTARGRVGYGLSEFLDQIDEDGVPVSIAEGRA